eukprot:jgi/Phyca11/15135/fgenesh1_pg.PHYCAscaffold_11_\
MMHNLHGEAGNLKLTEALESPTRLVTDVVTQWLASMDEMRDEEAAPGRTSPKTQMEKSKDEERDEEVQKKRPKRKFRKSTINVRKEEKAHLLEELSGIAYQDGGDQSSSICHIHALMSEYYLFNSPARGKMKTLTCAIVGVAGSAFPVDIDANKLVGHLKDAIKEKKMYQFPADELQLFLAKKADGAWLSSKDPEVISMRSGDIPEQVKTLMNVEVDPTDDIEDVFEGAPTKKTVHVLVVERR